MHVLQTCATFEHIIQSDTFFGLKDREVKKHTLYRSAHNCHINSCDKEPKHWLSLLLKKELNGATFCPRFDLIEEKNPFYKSLMVLKDHVEKSWHVLLFVST